MEKCGGSFGDSEKNIAALNYFHRGSKYLQIAFFLQQMEQFTKLDLLQQRDLQRVLNSISRGKLEKVAFEDLSKCALPKVIPFNKSKQNEVYGNSFITNAKLLIKLHQNRKEISLVKELTTQSHGLLQAIALIWLIIFLY
jgi:CRISPR/Cas system-associated endoribonuclease Cas2